MEEIRIDTVTIAEDYTETIRSYTKLGLKMWAVRHSVNLDEAKAIFEFLSEGLFEDDDAGEDQEAQGAGGV